MKIWSWLLCWSTWTSSEGGWDTAASSDLWYNTVDVRMSSASAEKQSRLVLMKTPDRRLIRSLIWSHRMKMERFWARSWQWCPHLRWRLAMRAGNVWRTWAWCLQIPPACRLCPSPPPRPWPTGGGRAPLILATSPLSMTSGCPRRPCWNTWIPRTEGNALLLRFSCLFGGWWKLPDTPRLCLHFRILRRTRVGGENRV